MVIMLISCNLISSSYRPYIEDVVIMDVAHTAIVHIHVPSVKKTEEVDEFNFFSLCVGTMESTICKTPSGQNPTAVGNSGLEFKFTPVTKITNRGEIQLLTAIMTIPGDTQPGIYGFKIYVCPAQTEMSSCTGLGNSYGQFDFITEVK